MGMLGRAIVSCVEAVRGMWSPWQSAYRVRHMPQGVAAGTPIATVQTFSCCTPRS
jgi:hypothetical protein